MDALLGILAGHLFLYRGWVPAACGIALLVASEAFDSADGQLARLSGEYSKLGRILDGLASNLVFLSIYIHLGVRMAPELGTLANEVLGRIAMTGEVFFILRALGYDIPFTTAFCIDAASSLALNVLFFVPFDLGVREGGLYLILPVFGLPPEVGIYVALVSRVRELFWIGVGLLWGHVFTASSPGRLSPARPDRW